MAEGRGAAREDHAGFLERLCFDLLLDGVEREPQGVIVVGDDEAGGGRDGLCGRGEQVRGERVVAAAAGEGGRRGVCVLQRGRPHTDLLPLLHFPVQSKVFFLVTCEVRAESALKDFAIFIADICL